MDSQLAPPSPSSEMGKNIGLGNNTCKQSGLNND
jgi:hypothetical protein